MIEEISIRGLGVIGEATLPLGPGLTVVTGETGAGKTMVVTALGLLLGDRADAATIRSGHSRAVVEGRWSVADDGAVAERVRDAGGDVEDGELILGRSVSSEGRSRAVIGGRSAPVSVLTDIGHQLVVVHGQSDQLRLRSSTAQREALDRFAGEAASDLLRRYASAYSAWIAARDELQTLVADRDRRAREADGLRVAIDEIEAASPQPGEDDELAAASERLANIEDLRLAAAGAHEQISSEEIGEVSDVIGLLDAARRQLDRVAGHDPELPPIVEALREASFLAIDISGRLAAYLGDLDTDAGHQLEAVQERRADLVALTRKYGPTLDDVIAYLGTASVRLLELDSDTDRVDELHRRVEEERAEIERLGGELSAVRSAAGSDLSARVTAELSGLAMGDAALLVEVTAREEFTATGRDQVSFLLQPHPGSDPRPLARGASGGELSRVMLAIEVVMAGADPMATFVFDEVDAGVGGASAIEVGKRLAELAREAQVIVVTHLAQVAAFATNHLRVVKDGSGAVTESSVVRLDDRQRLAEMARLLSGLPDSGTALDHARELIDTARGLVR